MNKYQDRVNKLEKTREKTIFGLTSRQLKLKLNKLGKTDDYILLIRKLYEIEDVNNYAKKYPPYSKYVTRYYETKNNLLKECYKMAVELEMVSGVGKDDKSHIDQVIYFDLKETGLQISWHFKDIHITDVVYSKKWDGKINTTYDKIFKEIMLYLEKHNLNL